MHSAQKTPPGHATLPPMVAWALAAICSVPLPIHNYLLISCFVCAIVAAANEMTTTSGRQGGGRGGAGAV